MLETDPRTKLTIDERLEIQEWLMRAVLWGPYLDDPIDRAKIADLLNKCVSSAEQQHALSPRVLAELRFQADTLLGIDGMPEHLKSALRP
jgi:hypothetical protein